MESVGASERMALAEPGYKSEELGSDRYLHKLFPIVSEAKPKLLKLGGEQEPFPPTASKGGVDLGECKTRGGDRVPLRCRLAHSLGPGLRYIKLD